MEQNKNDRSNAVSVAIITDDTDIQYDNITDLSYYDYGGLSVSLYVKKKSVGEAHVWRVSSEKDREYVILNNTIVYLDTIRKYEKLKMI